MPNELGPAYFPGVHLKQRLDPESIRKHKLLGAW